MIWSFLAYSLLGLFWVFGVFEFEQNWIGIEEDEKKPLLKITNFVYSTHFLLNHSIEFF
jgi:hypothetical protein